MGGKFTKLCAIGLQIKLNTCSWVELWQFMLTIIYIKATVVSVCVGSVWKILPVIAVPCGVLWGVGEGRAR
jgi:hypothetical protein